jgi:hypothetical protein
MALIRQKFFATEENVGQKRQQNFHIFDPQQNFPYLFLLVSSVKLFKVYS